MFKSGKVNILGREYDNEKKWNEEMEKEPSLR